MKKSITSLLSAALIGSTILGASMLSSAFAAQHPVTGEELAENQEFTYWLLDAIKSLDPHINTDVEGSGVARGLFEGLMNADAKGDIEPGVALSYDLSDDKRTYTFHLRKDAKWSNGDPVTANDFVYSWKRLADPKTASEYAWYMELMQVLNSADIIKGKKPVDELGVKAVDDHTFEVTIEAPLPYFPKMLTHSSTFPVHKATVEKFGDKWTLPENLVGNGAYTLDKHIPGEKIVLTRNPNYWNDKNTIMNKVTGLTINDVNQGLTRYLAGELDRVDMPAGQYGRMKEKHPDEARSTPYSCSYIYALNLSDKGPEALKDIRVRKALSLAMNRDIIVNNILKGGQKPSYNWTHWATAGFEVPDLEIAKMTQKERDEKAIQLLKEAGYDKNNPLKLTLNYNTSEDHKKIAVAAQQFYKKIGVDLTLNNMEWKVHTDRMQNQDFDMGRYAWCGDYNEPSTYLDFFTSYSGHNNGKFFSQEYDDLMKASKTAENPLPLYQKAEEILDKEVPFVPIYHYSKVEMVKPDIKGVPSEDLGQNWYARTFYRVAE